MNQNNMEMYQQLGISREVYELGEQICTGLKERFEKIDEIAKNNQLKVVGAMQKNKVGEA